MTRKVDAPTPDARELRHFALTVGGATAVLFGLFFPWLLSLALPLWPWVVAGVLGVWGLAAPVSLGPLYRAWMRLGALLHRIVSPLVLGLMFFLVITPVALVMRLAGRDALGRRINRDADTYRIVRDKPPREKMEKPY